MNAHRWDKLHRFASEQHLDALFVTDPEDVAYLTGFQPGSLIVSSEGEAHLLVDETDYAEAESVVTECELLRADEGSILERMAGLLRSGGIDRLGYSAALSHDKFLRLDRLARRRRLCRQLVVMHGLGRRLRGVKDDEALAQVKRCCAAVDSAFSRVLEVIEEGMTEFQLAAEIESVLRRGGSEVFPFPTVVGSGPRSAYPHASPTGRSMSRHDLVLCDFGARMGQGIADMTRTLVIREADSEQRKVHDTVMRAREEALQMIAPGRRPCDIDSAARRKISSFGYGAYFPHGLGHSLGGGPDLTADETEELKPGHVLTVEPGIYIPGWGGIRVEDVVLVTADGYCVLTRSPRRLIEV